MGACLSATCQSNDGVDSVQRDPTRRRTSRTGSNRQDPSRSICGRAPVPDFGVNSIYRVMELLGEGGTGQTYLCQELKSARRVAIKFIPRPLAKILIPMVSQEIQLQAQLSEGHLGLVRVESALLSRTHLGLVMEYVDGGTLTQYVIKRAANRGERGGLHLVEDEARYFFRQLIASVEYLHNSHVAHRDLKMCNVVLTQRRPPTLKLCDFGFAKGWDDSSYMNTRIGTPVYMSPQLIASKNEGKAYSATAADVWACGVMLFAMLLGRFPYDHHTHPDPNSSGAHMEVWSEQMKVMDGDWAQSPQVAPHIALLTDDCKDLLAKMLCTEEAKRITIPEIRNHPWFATILPPYLDTALKEWEEKQARIAKVMESAAEEQIKRRNKTVHDLIVQAGATATAPKTVGRTLSPISSIFENIPEGEGVSTYVASGGANAPPSPAPAPGPPAVEPAVPIPTPPPLGTVIDFDPTKDISRRGKSLPQASGAGTVEQEREVIMIELAAVAKRTMSDGLMLMPSILPDSTAGHESSRNGNCDSEDTECGGSSGGGASPGGGGSGRGARAAADIQAQCRTDVAAAAVAAAALRGANGGDRSVRGGGDRSVRGGGILSVLGGGDRSVRGGGERSVRGGGVFSALGGGERSVRGGGVFSALGGGERSVRGGGVFSALGGGERSVRGGGVFSVLGGGERSVRGGGVFSALGGGERSVRGGGVFSALGGGERSVRGGGVFSALGGGERSVRAGGVFSALGGGDRSVRGGAFGANAGYPSTLMRPAGAVTSPFANPASTSSPAGEIAAASGGAGTSVASLGNVASDGAVASVAAAAAAAAVAAAAAPSSLSAAVDCTAETDTATTAAAAADAAGCGPYDKVAVHSCDGTDKNDDAALNADNVVLVS